jgi:biopolymer transport protein ExbD
MAATIHDEEPDFGFQIAPMVDVIFVLMLFFMACIGFDKSRRLGASIPTHSKGARITPIEITIAADGGVYLLNRLVAASGDRKLPELSKWLSDSHAQFGNQDPIIIAPAPSVPHSRLMEVLGVVNGANWPSVTFR